MSEFVKKKIVEVVEADIDWAGIARAVEDLVLAKLHDDLAHWSSDRGMRAMFLADASAGLEVCELLADGVWHPAEVRLRNMDTAARDCVYDFIEQVAGEDFFDLVR